MSIQDIINGIVGAIYTEFGAGCTIYTEKVPQGFDEPCFFVKVLDPAQNRDLGRRYQRTHQFSIQYFPSTEGSYAERQTAAESLFSCLSEITADSRVLHGKDLQSALTDDILTLTVSYDVMLLEEYSEQNMTDLDVAVNV